MWERNVHQLPSASQSEIKPTTWYVPSPTIEQPAFPWCMGRCQTYWATQATAFSRNILPTLENYGTKGSTCNWCMWLFTSQKFKSPSEDEHNFSVPIEIDPGFKPIPLYHSDERWKKKNILKIALALNKLSHLTGLKWNNKPKAKLLVWQSPRLEFGIPGQSVTQAKGRKRVSSKDGDPSQTCSLELVTGWGPQPLAVTWQKGKSKVCHQTLSKIIT